MRETRAPAETPPDERITDFAYDAADPQFLSDPTDYYRWLRDEQPVHAHASGGVLLSRFQDVWDATADWQSFSSQSPVAKLEHMASMDPPGHDRLRSRVAGWFTPGRSAQLEGLVRSSCRELLQPLEERRSADLVGAFSAIFPSRVIHRLLGVARALDEPLRRCALEVGHARDAAELARGMQALAELAGRVVAGDPAPEQPGLIQALQAARGEDRLREGELRGVCSNLVLAGSDTVTNLVGNGLVLLARHPEARERLARDRSAIPAAVEEMLRFESPVQSLARRTLRTLTLHGVEIPAGTEVRLLWGAANRDDREFERADVFDIERRMRRHLAFGHGIHFCLGAALARLEARVALEEILARWPRYELDASSLVRLPSLWVRAWERVVVELR